MNNLIDEIGEIHEQMSINKLYVIENDAILLTFFKSCHDIQSILIRFDILFRKFPNKFSVYFLKSALESSTSLSLQNFVVSIWNPLYNKCELLINSLKDKSIELVEVRKIYEKYINHGENVVEQLYLLHSALELCEERNPSSMPPAWIKDTVDHMNNYLSLCKQSSAARLILELRDRLNLTGDFTVVEDVVKQIASSTQGQSLSAIHNTMVAAVSFFGELLSNPRKCDCIEAYLECYNIIQWIHNETKGKY